LDYTKVIYEAALKKLTALGFPNAAALASYMVAQSQHETANYTSNLFKKNNNAFGYKRYAGSTYQLGTGQKSPEGDNYAAYANVSDSALEVAAWLGRRKTQFLNVSSVDQYVSEIKKDGYFGDSLSNYLADVKKYLASFTVPQVLGISLIPVLLVGGILVYKFLL
jgi:hypothetical protein